MPTTNNTNSTAEDEKKTEPKLKKEELQELAHQVLRGEHGRGDARKKSLGKNYDAVQAEVLKIRKGN